MVDLRGQYEKIKKEVDAGIQAVIDNTQFIKGPQIKQFEEALAAELGVKHVIACANGTDALQIAMMALDLKPGDEVILPVFTYVATAEVIALLGLTPVMVDVDPDTFCIDVNLIEAKITPRTKAIVPVHLFGQCADMGAIMQIAKKHNLFVIEDTAQAIGAKYTFKDGSVMGAGCIGTVGTTSFFPSKNLGCYGDGGALMTNNDELARNEAANWYDELLGNHPNLIIPKRNPNSTHVFHQYTLQIVGLNRDEVRRKLAEKNIPSMVYYPIELHKQKAFAIYNEIGEQFPVSEKLCATVLSLPIHTEMTKEMVEFICSNFISIIEQ